MENVTLNNVPTLNISEIVSTLSESYISYIENGIKFSEFPSVMLWGAPGVGKSQSVREIEKNIKAKTGKTTNVIDVRLLLFNPIDLRGIPTTDKEKQNAIWLKPKIFDIRRLQYSGQKRHKKNLRKKLKKNKIKFLARRNILLRFCYPLGDIIWI